MKYINKILLIVILFISFTAQKCFGQEQNEYLSKFSSLKLNENHSPLFESSKVSLVHIISDSNKVKSSFNNIIPPSKTKLHPVRLGIVLGGMFTGWLGMHVYYSQTWWKNRVHYFKFAEDPFYGRDVDKLSHVYTANLITVGSASLFEWTGLNPALSLALGSTTAIAYETYIEINDGLSPDWGFDWGDMAGNLIGSLYPVAQRYVPALRTINFKWSFKPSWLQKKLRNYPDLLDDYTSMKFWITFNPYDLMPKKWQKYYPSFLGYGVGVTIQNASHITGATNAFREWYVAFDIDVTKLPGNTDFLKKLKAILNFYHIPTPGIKLSPGKVWYGLLF